MVGKKTQIELFRKKGGGKTSPGCVTGTKKEATPRRVRWRERNLIEEARGKRGATVLSLPQRIKKKKKKKG